MKILLNLEQTSERLRKTPEGFRGMRKRGTAPPAAKIAGKLAFDEDVVEKYLADAFEKAAAGPTDAPTWTPRVPLLTTPEVARRLNRTEQAVRWMRHRGTGPRAAVIGGTVLYREDDVDAFIDAALATAS